MKQETGAVWRVAVDAPDADAAEGAAAAIGSVCGAVSAFESAPGGAWRVEGFAAERPDMALLSAMLALVPAPTPTLARARGREGPAQREGGGDWPPALTVERIAERDWLGENQASFPPLAAGRYFIHGSHHREPVPAGRVGLLIDAATAFGTGEHATTQGCLLALDRLARQGRRLRVLDMGTGTGILAIAAAKTWRRPVTARDIDAEAVRVTRRNAWVNGVAALIDVRRSDGYRDRGLRRAGRFDLVLANILARPLTLMAPSLARALTPGGTAVLSGLLARQEAAVLAAHRAQGLRLQRRIAINGWHTLVLRR